MGCCFGSDKPPPYSSIDIPPPYQDTVGASTLYQDPPYQSYWPFYHRPPYNPEYKLDTDTPYFQSQKVKVYRY